MKREQRIEKAKREAIADCQQEGIDAQTPESEQISFLYGRLVAARLANEDLCAALDLCNESRNRLTSFKTDTDFWIEEARYRLEAE